VRERRREYELMIVVSPLVATEDGVNGILERLRNSIEGSNGVIGGVNHSAPWGRRKLAYGIREYVSGEASRRNFSEGYYVLIHFTLPAAKVAEVERTIKLTDTILRHLITQVEQKSTKVISTAELPEEEADDLIEELDD
jgi:small subunit ribosomal protein S6